MWIKKMKKKMSRKSANVTTMESDQSDLAAPRNTPIGDNTFHNL